MIIIFILIIHDIGHIIVLKKLGYKIDSIEILPFGGNIKTNMNLNSSSKDIFFVSIAGVLAQVILYVFIHLLYQTGIISDITNQIFLKYNTLLIFFNMLPIYPLDGNKALNSLLEYVFSFRLSLKISNIISIVCLLVFLYINYLYGFESYPVIFFLMFKVLCFIKEYNFVINKFLVERVLIENRHKKIKNISSIKNIYKNRFNFINGVSEVKCLSNFKF